MDIFNRKRIKELEEKLYDTELERDKYIGKAAELDAKLREIGRLEESVPTDCVKGPWCEACEFVRTFHYRKYYGHSNYSTNCMYVCGKGESCKNFVQRKVEE